MLFHNEEYRHLLRSEKDYFGWQDFARIDRPRKKWRVLYQQIKQGFENEGLPVNGFSKKHTKIIENILGFRKGYLVSSYHTRFHL